MKIIDKLAVEYSYDEDCYKIYDVGDIQKAYKAGFQKARQLSSQLFHETLNIRHTAGEQVLQIGENEE